MHKLLALYNQPEDSSQFRKHLEEVHLPLVSKFPGLRALRHGFEIADAAQASAYFAVVECEFDDEAAMNDALASAEAAAAAADVPNYANAGVTILTFAVERALPCEQIPRRKA